MQDDTKVWKDKTREEIICILKDEIEAVEKLLVVAVPKEDIRKFGLKISDFPTTTKAKRVGGMAYNYRIVTASKREEVHDYVVWLGYLIRLLKKKEMEAVQTGPDQYVVNIKFAIRTSLVAILNFKDRKLTIKAIREVDTKDGGKHYE